MFRSASQAMVRAPPAVTFANLLPQVESSTSAWKGMASFFNFAQRRGVSVAVESILRGLGEG